jgi:hypothetical protein
VTEHADIHARISERYTLTLKLLRVCGDLEDEQIRDVTRYAESLGKAEEPVGDLCDHCGTPITEEDMIMGGLCASCGMAGEES